GHTAVVASAVPAHRRGADMIIVVNGESREVAEGMGLTDLLREMELPPEQRGIAVARNGDVVLRASWPDTTLLAGDRLEILHAVQGG
ncbi:MAG: sulfur carrier protein ThiS, partial [Candidatus Dormiibacterota bacterium]